ncbi:hypothetical protein COW36_23775 [bacterium (Candidatus Blackallbacteria) CG17_big_fil_post_rev_8_21_14_2_50_48_46]|uniref:Urease accessory protein UreF n=1 Tax=bacterium (Candidatus Blackallbacteria) CG17_big_fil_post_rev_8_21_14_2_50_48_46 TaxID=2014261 RepID=A0A2M7FXQ8_9BACT|nr:MAG: hypothetical protein COW64_17985 [bacterium (Candidatus Blackallbacteria) CG18_big_fil_WC_8_21_14_2_50_49_26]PIW14057.1 MAG: hypothetical protein COW36_23775 [bacterium (Candidatus Blackallbacteria) CG17_big_fil_post_rev_8_21_14_2_50_48_46]PIW50723.1 MAG: hypothetical protein COW20_01450 [bacterium (Candidatus Blackallbacteria) CG13_big_fil_rev_8_21_14_2_50_49_14]
MSEAKAARSQALLRRALILQQIFDSQFPLGGFAHSNGLEAYTTEPPTPDFLLALLENHLRQGGLWLELSALSLVYRGDDPETLSAEISAWKSTPGAYLSSLALGKRLKKMALRFWKKDLPKLTAPHFCLLIACLGQALELPQAELAAAYAQNQLQGMLSACTRCLAFSPEQAQEILIQLQPSIAETVPRSLEQPFLRAGMPALDLRGHQQQYLYSRLFQS